MTDQHRWLQLEVTPPDGSDRLDLVAEVLPGKWTWLTDMMDDPPFPFAHIAQAEVTDDGRRLILWVWEARPPEARQP